VFPDDIHSSRVAEFFLKGKRKISYVLLEEKNRTAGSTSIRKKNEHPGKNEHPSKKPVFCSQMRQSPSWTNLIKKTIESKSKQLLDPLEKKIH
jgi:hypothetical protein